MPAQAGTRGGIFVYLKSTMGSTKLSPNSMEKDESKKLSTKTTVIVVAVVVVVAVLTIMNSYNGLQDSSNAAIDAGNTAKGIANGPAFQALIDKASGTQR